ncbi:MAG: hypothetical protein FJ109_10180, partial [Deltaproteobacteria bacterium]|nr:hypothetical protein [Deltaproteobacteria bacterium]
MTVDPLDNGRWPMIAGRQSRSRWDSRRPGVWGIEGPSSGRAPAARAHCLIIALAGLVLAAGCNPPPAPHGNAPGPSPSTEPGSGMPGPTESAGQGREIPVPTASNQPGSGATGPDAGTNGGRLHLLASAETGDPAALELPLAGPARPEVVLIQSGDYRCPFTQKAEKALAPLLAERKVQRYFLAAPGSPDAGAYVMAVAAAAAQRQGRFWEIHPLLLQMGSDVSEDRLLQAAREVGLDIPTFIKDLQRPELKAHVERQRVLAAALALSATPSFLVNGRLVVGWPGSEVLAQLLDEEAAEVARHVTGDRGLPEVLRQQCGRHPPLAIVMEQGLRFTDPPVHRLDPADEGTRWRVPLRPAAGGIGAEDSPVVVVEYLDPACPHSAKAYRQARALADGNSDVRFVFKLAPRRSDPESLRKSRLAFAAMDRGSFLECADALLAAEVTEETAAAACLGVSPVSPPDESRFAAWLADVRVEALAVAATGTPTIFINGRRLVGALEDAGLLRAMEQERETARELEQRGVAPARIHDWLTSTGRVESFLSPESRPVKCVECPLLADGGPGAREMLVAFDYRSPFSLNLATHL